MDKEKLYVVISMGVAVCLYNVLYSDSQNFIGFNLQAVWYGVDRCHDDGGFGLCVRHTIKIM